jgi:hypothetical protein
MAGEFTAFIPQLCVFVARIQARYPPFLLFIEINPLHHMSPSHHSISMLCAFSHAVLFP